MGAGGSREKGVRGEIREWIELKLNHDKGAGSTPGLWKDKSIYKRTTLTPCRWNTTAVCMNDVGRLSCQLRPRVPNNKKGAGEGKSISRVYW